MSLNYESVTVALKPMTTIVTSATFQYDDYREQGVSETGLT